MVSVDFGETDLAGCDTRTQILANFVDEALRANARNWEEKKKFLSHQDLCVKWAALITRKASLLKAANGNKDKGKQGEGKDKRRVPSWVCKAFNDGKCTQKDDRREDQCWIRIRGSGAFVTPEPGSQTNILELS